MWSSNAKWSKIPDTKDHHDTEKQAAAVCNMLFEEYGHFPGCPDRGICIAVWIENDNEKEKDHAKV